MFCPHCGYEVTSERVRFCTQCRFPISSLKEFLATETAKYEVEEAKRSFPSFLIVAAIVIPVILLWTRIVRFFFDVDTRPARSDLNAVAPFFNAAVASAGSALPHAQIPATADLNAKQVKKEEEGVRFSVTEDTTELLK